MKQETIFDISITFWKTRYTFFCPFLPFPKVPVKNLLKLCTWCSRFKSTCSTSSLTIIYSRFLVSWRQLPGEKTDLNSTSSLTIIYSHFLVSWRQLPGEKTDINILCKPLWKRYQCRLLGSITSSQPWKIKNVNISTLQSVKLQNYFYGNESEGCNISRI